MRECDGSDPPDFDSSPMISGLVTNGTKPNNINAPIRY